jgi:hypothetical protein
MHRAAAKVLALAPDISLPTPARSWAALITQTIPIVFAGAIDPVGGGRIAILSGFATNSPAPTTKIEIGFHLAANSSINHASFFNHHCRTSRPLLKPRYLGQPTYVGQPWKFTMKDAHNKAAEHHENAAKSHRAAAESHGKNDHAKGKEHSTQAQQHAQNASEQSKTANAKSVQQK